MPNKPERDAWIFEFLPDDVSSGSAVQVPVRVSTHGFNTTPDTGTPADLRDKQWPRLVTESPTYSVTLPEGLFGVARTRLGNVFITNPSTKAWPTQAWTGEQDALRDYAWSGRPFRAWRSPNGAYQLWEDYTEEYSGTVERMIPRLYGFEILLSDNAARLDQPLTLPTYMGLDRALSVGTGSNSNHGDVLDLSGEFTLMVLARFSSGDLAKTNQRPFDKFSTTGWRMELNRNGNGSVYFLHTDFADVIVSGTGYVTEDELWHSWAVTWEPAGIATGYVRMYKDGVLIHEATESKTAPLTDFAHSLILESNSTCKYTDFRIYDVRRTEEQIRSDMHRRIPGNSTNLVGYWYRLNVGGTLLLDETSGGNDGTVTSITEVDSGEGPEDLAGQYKPLTLGAGSNLTAGTLLSVADRVFAYGSSPHTDAPVLYDAGKLLVEGSGGGTNYTVDYARSIATIHTLFSSDLGQIRITAPGYDDGVDAPTTFGELVKFLLTNFGSFSASDLASSITSHASTAALEYHFPGGSEAPIFSDILRLLCSAVGSAIVPTTDGKLGALDLSAPSATGAIELTDDDIGDLEFQDLEEPTSSQRVGYAKTYAIQDLSELDTSNAADGIVEALRDPWRVAEDPGTLALSLRWPEAQPGELVKTSLKDQADALSLADTLQSSFWGIEGGVITLRCTILPDAPLVTTGNVVRLRSGILRTLPDGLLFVCRSHDLQRRVTLLGGFEP